MGLSYIILDKKEKEKIRDMEFTYENWKNKSLILMNDYINRNKKISPPEIIICFDDICFPMFVQMSYGTNFESNNFLKFIRDYFLLEGYKETFEGLRNENLYNNIRKQMIDLYPTLKEKYGMNKYLEKFLSYIIFSLSFTNASFMNFKIIIQYHLEPSTNFYFFYKTIYLFSFFMKLIF